VCRPQASAAVAVEHGPCARPHPAWSVKILLSFRTEEAVVARTPGASNRTPRELRAEAKRLVEKADHIEKAAALQKELEKAKAKRKESAR
jgi:hypothetical protein